MARLSNAWLVVVLLFMVVLPRHFTPKLAADHQLLKDGAGLWYDAKVGTKDFCKRLYPALKPLMLSKYRLKHNISMNGALLKFPAIPKSQAINTQLWQGSSEFSLWTRPNGSIDVVAEFVNKYDFWQPKETHAVLDRLDMVARRIAHQESLGEEAARRKTVLLDVGANQAWFTIAAAARGFSVIAIEAMAENELMIKASVCENGFADRVVVVGAAAGKASQTCYITSPSGDIGNGMVSCDLVDKDAFGRQVIILGTCPVISLDSLLAQTFSDAGWKMKRLGAAKIDVEGFEPMVLQGLEKSMAGEFGSKLNSIVLEYNPGMMDRIEPAAKHEMLERMAQLGFAILKDGFITSEQGGGLRNVPAGEVIGVAGVKAWEATGAGDKVARIPDFYFERS